MASLKNVNVVGGMSMPGSISIISENFQATASWPNDSSVPMVEVKSLNSKVQEILKKKNVPKIVRLIVFLFSQLNWMIILAVAFIAFLEFFPALNPLRLLLQISNTNIPKLSPLGSQLVMWALVAVQLGYMAWMMRGVRKFHAAEHMVIAALRNERNLQMSCVKRQDRIDPYCGGRFILPLILAMVVLSQPVSVFLRTLPIFSVLPTMTFDVMITFIVYEWVLQVDAAIGWWNIKLFRWASYFLQKFLTTAPPDEKHLQIARAAMLKIISQEIKKQIAQEAAPA